MIRDHIVDEISDTTQWNNLYRAYFYVRSDSYSKWFQYRYSILSWERETIFVKLECQTQKRVDCAKIKVKLLFI